MQKIFAAIMTLMIVATVVAVFALGALSLTGGKPPNAEDNSGEERPSSPSSSTPL
jgi:hypothetical protein